MQKLVSIYFKHSEPGFSSPTENFKNGQVTEHLVEYLKSGYRVISVTSLGDGNGWVLVLLEKE